MSSLDHQRLVYAFWQNGVLALLGGFLLKVCLGKLGDLRRKKERLLGPGRVGFESLTRLFDIEALQVVLTLSAVALGAAALVAGLNVLQVLIAPAVYLAP